MDSFQTTNASDRGSKIELSADGIRGGMISWTSLVVGAVALMPGLHVASHRSSCSGSLSFKNDSEFLPMRRRSGPAAHLNISSGSRQIGQDSQDARQHIHFVKFKCAFSAPRTRQPLFGRSCSRHCSWADWVPGLMFSGCVSLLSENGHGGYS